MNFYCICIDCKLKGKGLGTRLGASHPMHNFIAGSLRFAPGFAVPQMEHLLLPDFSEPVNQVSGNMNIH